MTQPSASEAEQDMMVEFPPGGKVLAKWTTPSGRSVRLVVVRGQDGDYPALQCDRGWMELPRIDRDYIWENIWFGKAEAVECAAEYFAGRITRQYFELNSVAGLLWRIIMRSVSGKKDEANKRTIQGYFTRLKHITEEKWT